MKYRVDLTAHVSIVVEADNEYEARNIAEKKANERPLLLFNAYYRVDDCGIEEFKYHYDHKATTNNRTR